MGKTVVIWDGKEDNDRSTYEEKRYYICSIGRDVEEFERAAGGHWKVENNLYWQLDFTFRYELLLDYENEAERLLSMLDINAVKEALDSKGKSREK